MNWRFAAKKKVPSKTKHPKPKKTRNEKRKKTDDRFADKSQKGTVLLAGILEEHNPNITSDELSNVIIQRSLHSAKGNDIESDSNSDGQSSTSSSSDGEMDDCDLGRSAYVPNQNSPIVENSIGPFNVSNDCPPDDKQETTYLGDNWEWNCWQEHDIDEEIVWPKEYDHYNGPQGIQKGVGRRFHTILQCLFETTSIPTFNNMN